MRLQGSIVLICGLVLLASMACTVPLFRSATQAPTEQTSGRSVPTPASTAMARPVVVTSTSQLAVTQTAPADFCADPQPVALISRLKTALQTLDGEALATLISPVHGMDARLFRTGRIVNYDQESAKFLFVSTYVVDWGAAPGSGLETRGSFRDLMTPALLDVLNRNFSLSCNRVQVGGTTYAASWPYAEVNFYSVHDPGTQANGNLDWHTWLLGMEYVNDKPYLYALLQYRWEP